MSSRTSVRRYIIIVLYDNAKRRNTVRVDLGEIKIEKEGSTYSS